MIRGSQGNFGKFKKLKSDCFGLQQRSIPAVGSGISKSQQGFPLTLPTQVAPPPPSTLASGPGGGRSHGRLISGAWPLVEWTWHFV